MLFKFILPSTCHFLLVCCWIPNAQKSVKDEKIIGPLTDQFGSLFLPSSSWGSDLFKDELAQPHRVESKKVSRVQAMRREWEERSAAEFESLEQDSMQLTHYLSELRRKLELLRKSRHNKDATTSKEAIEKFSSSLRILEAANLNIVQFKQIRLAQLGGVEMSKSNAQLLAALFSRAPGGPETTSDSSRSLPHDLLTKISTDARKNFGDTIVNDLKKAIAIDKRNEPKSRLLDTEDFIILQRTALKMIDFLIKNDFASVESVRKIFREFDVLVNIAKYMELSYQRDMEEQRWCNTLSFGSYTMEHWYWRYLHDSFRVLSEREERRVHLYLSLETLERDFADEEASGSSLSLLPKESSLIDRLWASLGMKKEETTNPPTGKIENSREDFRKDVEQIMDLVMSNMDEGSDHQMVASISLVSLLELIDKYLSPGLLKEVMQNHPRSQELEKRLQLITRMTKMSDLLINVNSYNVLYPDLVDTNSIASQHRQTIFIDSIEQVLKIIPECVSIFESENTQLWSRFRSFFDAFIQSQYGLLGALEAMRTAGPVVS